MPLQIIRSTHLEELADALSAALADAQRAEPFAPQAVVVGSVGMARWLRHRIATTNGVCAGIDFPFPRPAIDGAIAWALGPDAPAGAFWRGTRRRGAPEPWSVEALAFRALAALPAHAPPHVADYLGGTEFVDRRAIGFGLQLGDVLERLVHERPEQALAWARSPAGAPDEHRWLAHLLADLGAAEEGAPPRRLEALAGAGPRAGAPTLRLFALSSIGRGDRARIAALGRHLRVELYVLAARATAGERSPVHTSLGAVEHDLDGWLAALPGASVEVRTRSDVAPTRLGALQRWTRQGGALEAAPFAAAGDRSLAFHACHGALRQVETLRDELLAAFLADPSLEPRDVLVVTPSLEVYAPLVAAVFDRSLEGEDGEAGRDGAERVPSIPVQIADLGLRRTNPVAETLLAALELSVERVTAPRLLALLGLEPVRRRFGLGPDDAAAMRELLVEAGLRWGLDADDKAAADQPALDANSVRFGLERIALGLLVPDEEGAATFAGAAPGRAPIAPLEAEDDRRLALLGALAGVVRTIAWLRGEVGDGAARPHPTAARWRALLTELAEDLTETSDAAAWLGEELRAVIEGLTEAALPIGERPLAPRAVHHWLEGRFELPAKGVRQPVGAVTVAPLESLRAVPFRVIALLGLDDGVFPRGRTLPTWDPFAARDDAQGESDRRALDRQLLLDTILAARERLWCFWTGHDAAKGSHRAAAVPVEELLGALGRAAGRSRGELVGSSPLQPWSEALFGAGARSFDGAMARAGDALRQRLHGAPPKARGLAASGAEELVPEAKAIAELPLDELARALAGPLAALLRTRLKLYVERDPAPVPEREPLELGTLDDWMVRDKILAAALEHEHAADEELAARIAELAEPIRTRLAGEGRLPLERGADEAIAASVEMVAQALGNAWQGTTAAGPLSLRVPLPDLLLSGEVKRVRCAPEGGQVMQWPHASRKDKSPPLLQAYVHLLAARASGLEATAQVVSCGDAAVQGLALDLSPAAARSALEDLVTLWRRARVRPLPLFEKTSSAVGALLADAEEGPVSAELRVRLEEKIEGQWFGDGIGRPGERLDRWIRPFFGDFDPIPSLADEGPESFLDLARRVWCPVYRAMGSGGSTKARAKPAATPEAEAAPAEGAAPPAEKPKRARAARTEEGAATEAPAKKAPAKKAGRKKIGPGGDA